MLLESVLNYKPRMKTYEVVGV